MKPYYEDKSCVIDFTQIKKVQKKTSLGRAMVEVYLFSSKDDYDSICVCPPDRFLREYKEWMEAKSEPQGLNPDIIPDLERLVRLSKANGDGADVCGDCGMSYILKEGCCCQYVDD